MERAAATEEVQHIDPDPDEYQEGQLEWRERVGFGLEVLSNEPFIICLPSFVLQTKGDEARAM